MKKKKVLSGLLALAMTASLFAGCGKAAGTSTEGGSSAEVGGNEAAAASEGAGAVSYTHLDVYKRQAGVNASYGRGNLRIVSDCGKTADGFGAWLSQP